MKGHHSVTLTDTTRVDPWRGEDTRDHCCCKVSEIRRTRKHTPDILLIIIALPQLDVALDNQPHQH